MPNWPSNAGSDPVNDKGGVNTQARNRKLSAVCKIKRRGWPSSCLYPAENSIGFLGEKGEKKKSY